MSDEVDRSRRLEALFHEALEQQPEARRALLATLTDEDPELAKQLSALLHSDGREDSPLDQPRRLLFGVDASRPHESWVGRRIGRYRLVRVVASGGMGVVFEAEQDDPRRTVALKLMRVALPGTSARRRFRFEAEVLARLSHPGIARVLEAGIHEEGPLQLPYFALEFVPGAETILGFAERRSLGVPERLALFGKVCQAVHHGHLAGVIHRDIKPENILVDPDGQPKVIDFGVARATDVDVALTTMHTDVGELVGTLQYMSPEQTLADPGQVDVRSDVYSLGMVLYELLCGTPPYDLRAALIPEAARIIRETAPRRPSATRPVLRGDVEAITLKCLEKQRARRYASAADLGRDIERYLGDQPVDARVPSPWRHVQLFARRHRAVAWLGAALLLALVGGTVVSVHYGLQASAHSREALEAREQMRGQRDAALESERAASEARAEAEELTAILVDAWRAITPERARTTDTTLLTAVLDRAAARADSGGIAVPAVEARVRALISQVYEKLARHAEALPHAQRSLELLRAVHGDGHRDTLHEMMILSSTLAWLGRFDEAEALALESLAGRERLLGPDDPFSMGARRDLGALYLRMGRLDEAEPMLRAVVDARWDAAGVDDETGIVAAIDLAGLLLETGRAPEALELLDASVARATASLGADHPETLRAQHDRAGVLIDLGRLDEAADVFVAMLDVVAAVFGEASLNHATIQESLAMVRDLQGREREAITHLTGAIESRRAASDGSDPKILEDLGGVVRLLHEAGEPEQALALAEQLEQLASATLGADSPPAVFARRFVSEHRAVP